MTDLTFQPKRTKTYRRTKGHPNFPHREHWQPGYTFQGQLVDKWSVAEVLPGIKGEERWHSLENVEEVIINPKKQENEPTWDEMLDANDRNKVIEESWERNEEKSSDNQ